MRALVIITSTRPSVTVDQRTGLIVGGVPGSSVPATPAERAADGDVTRVRGYSINSDPPFIADTDTQALIDAKLAEGWPAWAIDWEWLGLTTGAVRSATAAVPSFGINAALTAPTVSSKSVLNATATVPAFGLNAQLGAVNVNSDSMLPPTTIPVISATGGNGQTTVSLLSGGANATSYDLYWSTSPGVGVLGTRIGNVTLPYTHTGLTNEQTYYYTLKAINNSASAISVEVSATPAAGGVLTATATVPAFGINAALTAPTLTSGAGNSAPTAPTGISANNFLSNGTGFDIHYAGSTDSDGTVASYNIYRNGAFLVNTGTAVTTYSITGRTAGETADYQVSAVDNLGLEGALSSAASVTITPATPAITVTPGDTQNVIALASGGTGATSYNIKWGTVAGTRGNTIIGVTLPYTHTGRTNGTAYYYSLVAINAGGSVESAEVSGTPVVAAAPLLGNPGLESAISGSAQYGNWWPVLVNDGFGSVSLALAERVAAGSTGLDGSFVGHVKSLAGFDPDPDVGGTIPAEASLAQRFHISDINAMAGSMTYKIKPVVKDNYAGIAVKLYNSSNVDITDQTNNKNVFKFWGPFGTAAAQVAGNFTIGTVDTHTSDLKALVAANGGAVDHVDVMFYSGSYSDGAVSEYYFDTVTP